MYTDVTESLSALKSNNCDNSTLKLWYTVMCVWSFPPRCLVSFLLVWKLDLSAKRASSPSKGKGKGKSPLKQPALPPPSSGAVSSPLSKSKKKKEDIQDTFVSPSSASGGSGGVSFADFQKLCGAVENEPSFNAKTKIVQDFLERNAMEGVCVCVCVCVLCVYVCVCVCVWR